MPNVSEIYFLPFSEIRVGWTGFSACGIKKNKAPNYFSKSHTRVLKKKYSGDFSKEKMQTNERKQKNMKKFTDKKKKKCHLLFDDSEEDWVKDYYYYTIVQRCISTNAKF